MTRYHYYFFRYGLNNRGLSMCVWVWVKVGWDKRVPPTTWTPLVISLGMTNIFHKNSLSFLIILSRVTDWKKKSTWWSFEKTWILKRRILVFNPWARRCERFWDVLLVPDGHLCSPQHFGGLQDRIPFWGLGSSGIYLLKLADHKQRGKTKPPHKHQRLSKQTLDPLLQTQGFITVDIVSYICESPHCF